MSIIEDNVQTKGHFDIAKVGIKTLKDTITARHIGDFLTGQNAFDHTWSPKEKQLVKQAPLLSLGKSNRKYWYIEYRGEIIAALGISENKYMSGGYEMTDDYMAVHKQYRRLGIATHLLQQAEKFVANRHGRYIHIMTCDIDSYIPANRFYEKNGYRKVAEMKDYYVDGEGRIDFYKKIGKNNESNSQSV